MFSRETYVKPDSLLPGDRAASPGASPRPVLWLQSRSASTFPPGEANPLPWEAACLPAAMPRATQDKEGLPAVGFGPHPPQVSSRGWGCRRRSRSLRRSGCFTHLPSCAAPSSPAAASPLLKRCRNELTLSPFCPHHRFGVFLLTPGFGAALDRPGEGFFFFTPPAFFS